MEKIRIIYYPILRIPRIGKGKIAKWLNSYVTPFTEQESLTCELSVPVPWEWVMGHTAGLSPDLGVRSVLGYSGMSRHLPVQGLSSLSSCSWLFMPVLLLVPSS